MSEPSLRTRRREATRAEIQAAALDLFERYGSAEVTIAQIADAAGVSARTFFRYFSSKEAAVLPDLGRLPQLAKSFVPVDGPPGFVLEQLETLLEAELIRVRQDENQARLALLFGREPEIVRILSEEERDTVDLLRHALAEHCPSLSPADGTLLVELAMLTWQLSWAEGGRRLGQGQPTDPVTIFREHCHLLRELSDSTLNPAEQSLATTDNHAVPASSHQESV